MGMREDLERIREEALGAIDSTASEQELEPVRIRYSGKKGALTAILKTMGKLSAEERPVMGQLANEVRAQIEEKLSERFEMLRAAALEAKLKAEALDVTMPGRTVKPGTAIRLPQRLQMSGVSLRAWDFRPLKVLRLSWPTIILMR